MIAHANQQKTSEANERFVCMLPNILRVIRHRLRHQPRRDREELAAEALAAAFVMYASLTRRGRQNLAYATPLATYGCRRALDGRQCGTGTNVRDITSRRCQQAKRVSVESLDRYDKDEGAWREAVFEDHRTAVADQAAFRCDFPRWLQSLPPRDRKVAERLSVGESTGQTARRFGISSARVSQLRRELRDRWFEFHGELDGVAVAAR